MVFAIDIRDMYVWLISGTRSICSLFQGCVVFVADIMDVYIRGVSFFQGRAFVVDSGTCRMCG